VTALHLYRNDITGLRAFAVLAVVIFHAFPEAIPGGFIGVDVFFVISGFLISGILFKELDGSAFSFSTFYMRRVQRIFPALIVVICTTYASSWFLLFAEDFRQLGNHIAHASLFISNFLLYRESGYFDVAADAKPLLHLWSLAIEEQFYLLWPVILWAFWRFEKLRFGLLFGVTVISFSWNVYQSHNNLNHDFYSPLTRFWEFTFGALVAYSQRKSFLSTKTANWISLLSVCLLFFSVFFINRHTAFPGSWALVPVFGAGLLIAAGPNAWSNRVLFSNTPAIWIGLISYPLYLWHWPALVLVRLVMGETPSADIRLAMILMSFALAWGTYAWIERPIRYRWRLNNFIGVSLIVLMAGLGYAGWQGKLAGGYPYRTVMQERKLINNGDVGHDDFHAHYAEKFYPCTNAQVLQKSEKWQSLVRCYQTQPHDRIDLLLIGDSHSEHLLLGLAENFPKLNIAAYYRAKLPFATSEGYSEIFDAIHQDKHLKYVLVTAMWADKAIPKVAQLDFQQNLDATVRQLVATDKHVILVSDTPQFSFDPQNCKYSHPLSGLGNCRESSFSFQKIQSSYIHLLHEQAKANSSVSYINLDSVFCDPNECFMAKDGQLFFRDRHHVNTLGSRVLGQQVATHLVQMGLLQLD
jgi:peptidoglycan/LPS O-acetylase OafA/YrhL